MRWSPPLALTLTAGCVAAPPPGMVLLSAPAAEQLDVGLEGSPVDGPGPRAATPGARLAIDGELTRAPEEGVLRYVDVRADGGPLVDDLVLGEDVRDDAAWVVAARSEAAALATRLHGSTRFEDEDVWLVEADDLWVQLADPALLPADTVDELIPVPPSDATASEYGATWQHPFAPRDSERLLPVMRQARPDEATRAEAVATGAHPLPATPTLTLSREALHGLIGEAADWVGLYLRPGECLLLDASGGYRTCTYGIDWVAGTWTVSGGLLWVDNAEVRALSAATHSVQWDDQDPLQRVFLDGE